MSPVSELIRSPITGSSNIELEEELPVPCIIKAYQASDVDVIRYFDGIDTVKIYQCLDTQYRFYYPFSLSGDSELYEQLQQRPGYYRLKQEHWTAKTFMKPGDRVLEVGCGRGLFLQELQQEGIVSTGLEFNDAAVVSGQKHGLEIYKQDIATYAMSHSEEYDVVCSFQVLEHITSVKEFMTASLAVLKRGGKLIVGVPNNNPFLYKYDKYHALNLPPHHMGLWNRASLYNLQTQFPMSVEQIIVEPLHDYEREYYFKLLIENWKGHSKILAWVSQLMFLKLRPGRLRFKLQQLIASRVEGRNVLAIYTKR